VREAHAEQGGRPKSARITRGVAFALAALALSSCGSGTKKQAGSTAPPTTTAPTSTTPTTTPTTQPTTTNDGDGPSTSNNVTLGVIFGPGEEPPIGFGEVQVGSSRSLDLTVRNATVARTIVGITISEDDASEFRVTGGSCAIGTQLAVSESCTIEVTFTPKALGTRTVKLEISVDPGPPGGRYLRGGMGHAPPGPIHTGPPIETTEPTRTG
jgi:Abnormal spindle-like microcephaly-assoc'd, ASPM-SPD-2-Hydin